jgi:uncharacterized damage-inducible protein DinB
MIITKPDYAIAPPYYVKYFELVKEDNLLEALNNSFASTTELFESISEAKHTYSYAEGKWTVKELLSHITDSERIFAYRALRFSRLDETNLPGYEENLFAPNANTANRTLQEMINEFKAVRLATLSLFIYLSDDMLDFFGSANNLKVNSRMLGWMIAGHCAHHCNILKERYL